jgi:endo-1,4-beta-mannosidase
LRFLLGVNYWPAKRAMYWWRDFHAAEVRDDFRRLAELGFQVVRIFLLWEDFQPSPGGLSPLCLERLVAVADAAADCGMMIQPTFFCGHMSGANWAPEWLLGRPLRGRFPVVSGGRPGSREIRNYYGERWIIKEQQRQCREVARALRGHPALWSYDLGNEPSNFVVPGDRQAAREWLAAVAGELKEVADCPVTIGLHAEDLQEDRKLWPADAALYCDYLSMHSYPFYLDWVDHPLDVEVLPFLGVFTRWLGGKDVLFQEFGVSDLVLRRECPEAAEEAGVLYYRRALRLLQAAGMLGAFAWCYSDYHPDLFGMTPLRENPHERFFGLFAADGRPKKAAGAVREFAERIKDDGGCCRDGAAVPSWLQGEDAGRFYDNPLSELRRLYRSFKGSRELKEWRRVLDGQ